MPSNKGGYYAVHIGRKTGVFMSWAECEAQVKGFPNARFKKFPTREEATNFAESGNKANLASTVDKYSSLPQNVINNVTVGSSIQTSDQLKTVALNIPVRCTLNYPSLSKSQKKYYAVHRGRCPGVYRTWSECEQYVKDFEFPVYKSFDNKEEALEFVKTGNKVKNNQISKKLNDINKKLFSEHSTFLTTGENDKEGQTLLLDSFSKPQKESFYAVHRGKCPGVYKTWTECELQIRNFKGPSFRKFETEEEALDFVKTGGITRVSRRQTKLIEINQDFIAKKKKTEEQNYTLDELKIDPTKIVTVFTDGASSKNGKVGACAGIGVYWGPNHPLNTSMRLPGRQTNNRAEIHAAIHALKQAKQIGAVNIRLYTDSQFLISGITGWINKWKKNGWKLATGEPVVNKEDFLELDKARKDLNVEWIYIKAHDNNPGNVEADALAVAGAKKPLSETDIYLI